MIPTVVPVYAALLGLLYVYLMLRVSKFRRAHKISLGSGGDANLERAIRVHANFAEYVPLALILLTFMEVQGYGHWLINLLCLTLLGGRIAHAYGMSHSPDIMSMRAGGTMATLVVIVLACLILVIGGL